MHNKVNDDGSIQTAGSVVGDKLILPLLERSAYIPSLLQVWLARLYIFPCYLNVTSPLDLTQSRIGYLPELCAGVLDFKRDVESTLYRPVIV